MISAALALAGSYTGRCELDYLTPADLRELVDVSSVDLIANFVQHLDAPSVEWLVEQLITPTSPSDERERPMTTPTPADRSALAAQYARLYFERLVKGHSLNIGQARDIISMLEQQLVELYPQGDDIEQPVEQQTIEPLVSHTYATGAPIMFMFAGADGIGDVAELAGIVEQIAADGTLSITVERIALVADGDKLTNRDDVLAATNRERWHREIRS